MAEESGRLARFRAAYLSLIEAFNRHDFERAFADTAPDVEFAPDAGVPGGRTLRGREELIKYFHGIVGDFPDYRVEAVEFSEPMPGAVLVTQTMRGTGRISGARTEARRTFLWDLRSTPLRIATYRDAAEALDALRLRRRHAS
jgi:hypothetical protein